MGTMYIWHFGDMTGRNLKTGDKLLQNFKDKGWTSKDDFQVTGDVKDKLGVVKYTLEGRWNSHLNATNAATGQTIEIVKGLPQVPKHDWQYQLSLGEIQLNYMTKEIFEKCAPTDCRLRPDQRSFEYGDQQLGNKEKLRLEVKQRTIRKDREAKNIHIPGKWFEEATDSEGQLYHKYKGGYWEARESGVWPEDTEDIY